MIRKTILIVEDEHALAAALAMAVKRMGAQPIIEPSGSRAITAIERNLPDMIVLDIGLPDISGLDVLRKCFGESTRTPVPVVVVTAHGKLENTIAARQLGVAEFLNKPLDLRQFESVIKGLLEKATTPDSQGLTASWRDGEADLTLIGAAPRMQLVFRDIAHACTNTLPLVLSGGSGVGKTLAARVIHANSGGRAGALTVFRPSGGAQSLAKSVSQMAHHSSGSLLIEDVEELNEAQQAELMHLLDDQYFDDSASPEATKIRILATTKRDLYGAVSRGSFREGLYYRLRALEIHMPSLNERVEDIPALAAFFLGRASSDRSLTLSTAALDALVVHRWPGNIREMRHAIEYAVSICGGTQILPQHLPANVLFPASGESSISDLKQVVAHWVRKELIKSGSSITYAQFLDEFESILISELLSHFDNKPTHLAESLSMNRTTLRRRCERLRIRVRELSADKSAASPD